MDLAARADIDYFENCNRQMYLYGYRLGKRGI